MKSTGFFDYAKYLQLKTENCTSILRHFFKPFPCQICYIFSCPVTFLPSKIFDLLLYISSSLTKALSMRKALSMKQFIKASVRTRTYLVEFFWEVQLNFTLSFYRFVRFTRFSGINIYTICNTLLILTQNLLLNLLSYCIPLFRLFTYV